MEICTKCGVETERRGVELSDIYCFDCDPKNRCVDCGEFRMKPLGHSEYCYSCFEKHQQQKKETISRFKIIDKTKVAGTEMSESHYKDLNSRVIDDDGNSIRGQKGIEYMKSKGDTYASRLKEYYK